LLKTQKKAAGSKTVSPEKKDRLASMEKKSGLWERGHTAKTSKTTKQVVTEYGLKPHVIDETRKDQKKTGMGSVRFGKDPKKKKKGVGGLLR